MAVDTPVVESEGNSRPPRRRFNGRQIGHVAGIILFVAIAGAVAWRFDIEWESIGIFALLWGSYVGGFVGGMYDLRSRGRFAEESKFRWVYARMFPFMAAVTIIGIICDRNFGSIGQCIGVMAVILVAIPIYRFWGRFAPG